MATQRPDITARAHDDVHGVGRAMLGANLVFLARTKALLTEAGPTTDVLGTARPQSARFDLSVYEYKP